jgi:hypothetical protein
MAIELQGLQIPLVIVLKDYFRKMLSNLRKGLLILKTRLADFSATELGVDVFQK